MFLNIKSEQKKNKRKNERAFKNRPTFNKSLNSVSYCCGSNINTAGWLASFTEINCRDFIINNNNKIIIICEHNAI